MGRPAKYGGMRPHPSPQFKDKVRLYQFVSGRTDFGWRASYLINGQWTPSRPASLGTRDYDEACARAGQRCTLLENGIELPKAKSKKKDHSVARYAGYAITKLEAEIKKAALADKGKVSNFRTLINRIRVPFVSTFGHMDIRNVTEDILNDWAAKYQVEDQTATTALYGRQKRGPGRQQVLKTPAHGTLNNLNWAFRWIWDEAAVNDPLTDRVKIVSKRNRPVIHQDEFRQDDNRACGYRGGN